MLHAEAPGTWTVMFMVMELVRAKVLGAGPCHVQVLDHIPAAVLMPAVSLRTEGDFVYNKAEALSFLRGCPTLATIQQACAELS